MYIDRTHPLVFIGTVLFIVGGVVFAFFMEAGIGMMLGGVLLLGVLATINVVGDRD